MCQICAIKTLAARDRWPKPVEAHKKDLGFLIDTIHDEFETFKAKKMVSPKLMPPDSLLDVLRLLNAQLDRLEDDRKAWWSSPEKRAMRQRLELEGAQQKLSDLHKINNTTVSSIESLNAKFGAFVKWSMGLNGGIWELENMSKVKE